MQQDPLRIGRIARNVEKALKISLTGEVSVYISTGDLSAFAARYPDSYLRRVEEISHILHDPDFVCFEIEAERFVFERSYFKDGSFHLVYLSLARRGSPGRWHFESLKAGEDRNPPKQYQGLRFVRVGK